MPGRRLGSSSDRAAFSRNLAAKSAVAPSCRTTSACTSSGSGRSSRDVGRFVDIRKPHHEPVVAPQGLDVDAALFADASPPPPSPTARGCGRRGRQDADAPVAELVPDALDHDRGRVGHGAVWPPSDRAGTAGGFPPPSRRGRGRASAARPRPPAAGEAACASASRLRRPNSSGRPARSPFQNGILPGSPGAGDTSTRSCVISSIRQEDAPSTKVSPGRLSKTISSSSSPTRAVPRPCADEEHAVQAAVGDGAAVDDRHVASRVACDDGAARRGPR